MTGGPDRGPPPRPQAGVPSGTWPFRTRPRTSPLGGLPACAGGDKLDPTAPKEGSMQAQPELAVLGVRDPGTLDPYLERRRYARGERIMAQGTAGTECYLI